MEINQQFHTLGGGPLTDFDGVVEVAISTAISLAVGGKWVVPYSNTDIVNAVFSKNLINILRLAIVIGILYTAIFQCWYAGGIHAENKVRRQILYFLYPECIGENLGLHRVRPPIGVDPGRIGRGRTA